jgi:methylenetetrahydrofolate dehydrogenase (NADP+)/methenyltetrahydrofolate cyclohydrolase
MELQLARPDNDVGNATISVCHLATRDLKIHTRAAEIVIVAIGDPEFITGNYISEGAVVIDVGINRVDDPASKRGYRLTGDVHFDSVAPQAGLITPVPGGVGPMTVAMLMRNTVEAEKLQYGAPPRCIHSITENCYYSIRA